MQKCKSDLAQRVGATPGGHTSRTHASSRETACTQIDAQRCVRSTAHGPRHAAARTSVRQRLGGLVLVAVVEQVEM